MSVRLNSNGNCSWCGGSSHGATGWCPHEHLKNAPTTYAERVILERLCDAENAALRYGKQLKDIPGAQSDAKKLGFSV